ncbi:hypothetical protein [Trichococcus ilyis]|jgi:hypothetical protein|uniref:Uncharacterized protein n=1 Tax=Trichococcus ilyis TaxID=640938 RepID=A0A143Z880_9LACT|nr:hypothetical protein [Trichococcus ilyis]CZR10006.1 Hypothetical protein TR210_2840 [Trichococcus ilyis]SEJ88142.1 hypothetical protein SAMN05216375_13415 [Trichococcus ilyis]
MIFFKGFFGKKDTKASEPIPSATVSASAPANDLIEIPAFIPTDPNEYELVSVIATAIAAGDHPKSQFVVKNIMKRNPEAHLVSLISASIAAGAMPESKFVVKKISQVK